MKESIEESGGVKFDFKVDWQGKEPTSVTFDIEGAGQDDLILQLIRKNGTFYEAQLLRYLARRGPCGGVYVDVGANIGNHAVFFGKFLSDFLVAIEPSRRLAAVLRRNLAANGVTRAIIVECAVGATTGRGRLWLPPKEQHNVGATQVARIHPGDEGAGEDLFEISTVDHVIEGMSSRLGNVPVTLLKVDVEGMEPEVLMGSTNVIRFFRPQLVVELHTSEAFALVTTFLANFGYCAVGRYGGALTYHFINPTQHQLRMVPCDPGH